MHLDVWYGIMTQTDISLWHETAITAQPKWEARAQLISHLIRPHDNILDLGAGDQKLKKYIPSSCGYVPVDCVDSLPGTYVVDFNKEFRLPTAPFNLIVSAGFIEYIDDVESFMQNMQSSCDGMTFIFTISYTNHERRKSTGRYKKLTNFCTSDKVLDFFEQYTINLRHILRLKNQSLFVSQLSTMPEKHIRFINFNESIKPSRFWDRWTVLRSIRGIPNKRSSLSGR